MLERLDFADSEIRSGELQVWVTNFSFLHVAFIIRRNVNSSDAEYLFSSSFAVCLYAHFCIFVKMPMISVLFCFFLCLTSEASWLEQNQLSPVLDQQTGFDIHSSDAWRGKPLSLCQQGQIARSSNKREEER